MDNFFLSKQCYTNIIESMPDALIVIDLGGKMVSINKAGYVLLEYAENELLDNPIDVIFAAEDKEGKVESEHIHNLLAEGDFNDVEMLMKTKTGNLIPVLFRILNELLR